MRPYPSSFFILLSNIYCSPTPLRAVKFNFLLTLARFSFIICGRQLDKAQFEQRVEMSRSWSSAHDWKSCKGQKPFESSNLSISAKVPHPGVRDFFHLFSSQIPALR